MLNVNNLNGIIKQGMMKIIFVYLVHMYKIEVYEDEQDSEEGLWLGSNIFRRNLWIWQWMGMEVLKHWVYFFYHICRPVQRNGVCIL